MDRNLGYMNMDAITTEALSTTIFYELQQSDVPINIVMRYVMRMFCALAIITDILIIYVICQCKNLKQPDNLYMKHWLICDCLFLFLGITNQTMIYFISYSNLNCIVSSIPTVFRLMETLFVIFMLFYWCYGQRQLPIFKTHYNKLKLGIYLFGLLDLLALIYTCFWVDGERYFQSYLFLLIDFYSIGMIFNISCCIRGFVSPFARTAPLSIALCTSFVLFKVTLKIVSFCLYNQTVIDDKSVWFWSTVIEQLLVYSYPFVVLILLYSIDDKFALWLRIVLRLGVTENEVSECYADVLVKEDINENEVTQAEIMASKTDTKAKQGDVIENV